MTDPVPIWKLSFNLRSYPHDLIYFIRDDDGVSSSHLFSSVFPVFFRWWFLKPKEKSWAWSLWSQDGDPCYPPSSWPTYRPRVLLRDVDNSTLEIKWVLLHGKFLGSQSAFLSCLFFRQIIAINGISLVGLPLSTCQNYIKVSREENEFPKLDSGLPRRGENLCSDLTVILEGILVSLLPLTTLPPVCTMYVRTFTSRSDVCA